jgi:beta-lactamase class A
VSDRGLVMGQGLRPVSMRIKTMLVVGTVSLILAGCVSPSGRGDRAPSTSLPTAGAQPWRPGNATPRPTNPRETVQPRRGDPGAERPPPGLEPVLHEIWRTFPGRTGIAVRRIDGNWSLSRRGEEFFPQQSVSKTWVALALLDRVDAGDVRLTDTVRISGDDLTLFSQPIARRVQRDGTIEESVASLLEQSITGSDNTANDSLLRTIGGPETVRRFITSRNLGRIRFGPGERLLQSRIAGMDWQQRYSAGRNFQVAREAVPIAVRRDALNRYLADPEDGASPEAIVTALARLARGDLLSPASTRVMLDTMARTRTGAQRLAGGLSPGWTLAHKTGTGQELEGRATGYNNIGILTAPDGTRYAIAVMLADTTASVPARMDMMQSVTRAVIANHGR